jgi:hypothetical protein
MDILLTAIENLHPPLSKWHDRNGKGEDAAGLDVMRL